MQSLSPWEISSSWPRTPWILYQYYYPICASVRWRDGQIFSSWAAEYNPSVWSFVDSATWMGCQIEFTIQCSCMYSRDRMIPLSHEGPERSHVTTICNSKRALVCETSFRSSFSPLRLEAELLRLARWGSHPGADFMSRKAAYILRNGKSYSRPGTFFRHNYAKWKLERLILFKRWIHKHTTVLKHSLHIGSSELLNRWFHTQQFYLSTPPVNKFASTPLLTDFIQSINGLLSYLKYHHPKSVTILKLLRIFRPIRISHFLNIK